METKQKERIRRLMELLKKTDRIHLKDAARMLEVSVMTIRRDLHQEDEPLPLTLLGGYIVMVNKPDVYLIDFQSHHSGQHYLIISNLTRLVPKTQQPIPFSFQRGGRIVW
jgi:DeoR/GlpR family transcriptional regulator of sugar metabolism